MTVTERTNIWVVMLLLWVLPGVAFCQINPIEVKKQIEQSSDPTEQMKLYYQLAQHNLEINKPVFSVYQAGQALRLAKSLNNLPYQRLSSIVLGKSFIIQGKIAKARETLINALSLGKKAQDPGLVLQAATLISGLDIRKGDYKSAYEINLDAINFMNLNRKFLTKERSKLKNEKKRIENELVVLRKKVDLLESGTSTVPTILPNVKQETIYVEVPVPAIPLDSLDNIEESKIETYPMEPRDLKMTKAGNIFRWLTVVLGLLSLALLGGLFYFWNKYQNTQDDFSYNLLEKDRLIRNYEEDFQAKDSKSYKKYFNSSSSKIVNNLSLLSIDLGSFSTLEDTYGIGGVADRYETVIAGVQALIRDRKEIMFIEKQDGNLLFATGLGEGMNNTEELFNLGKDIKDFLEEQKDFKGQSKIVMHSGQATLSLVGVDQDSVSLIGRLGEEVRWLSSSSTPGTFTVTTAASRDLINKDQLRPLDPKISPSGTMFNVFKLT